LKIRKNEKERNNKINRLNGPEGIDKLVSTIISKECLQQRQWRKISKDGTFQAYASSSRISVFRLAIMDSRASRSRSNSR
jgi:hypothetical protein